MPKNFMEFLMDIVFGIYKFLEQVYNLVLEVAEFEIFTDALTKEIALRIYAIIGILLIAKLIITFLTFIISPKKATPDEKKNIEGFVPLVNRILITIALLLFTPFMFTFLTRIQSAVIRNGVIGNIVFGNNVNSRNNEAEMFAGSLLIGFFEPNEDYFGVNDSDIIRVRKDLKDLSLNTRGFGQERKYFAIKEKALEGVTNGSVWYVVWFASGYAQRQYYVNFNWFFALIVGIGALFLVCSVMVPIAIRTVKLAFLQMIAPFPIIANLEKGLAVGKKDSKVSYLDNYKKMLLISYIDLFVRIFSFAFLGLVATKLSEVNSGNFIIDLFILGGMLIFAKEAPNFVSKLLANGAIKGTSDMSYNPTTNLMGVPFVPEVIAFAGTTATSLVKEVPRDISIGVNTANNGREVARNIVSAVVKAPVDSIRDGFAAARSVPKRHQGLTMKGQYNLVKKSLGQGKKNRIGRHNNEKTKANTVYAGVQSQNRTNNAQLQNDINNYVAGMTFGSAAARTAYKTSLGDGSAYQTLKARVKANPNNRVLKAQFRSMKQVEKSRLKSVTSNKKEIRAQKVANDLNSRPN